jgi:hypothetical protein
MLDAGGRTQDVEDVELLPLDETIDSEAPTRLPERR